MRIVTLNSGYPELDKDAGYRSPGGFLAPKLHLSAGTERLLRPSTNLLAAGRNSRSQTPPPRVRTPSRDQQALDHSHSQQDPSLHLAENPTGSQQHYVDQLSTFLQPPAAITVRCQSELSVSYPNP
jgi:hypothetical protein